MSIRFIIPLLIFCSIQGFSQSTKTDVEDLESKVKGITSRLDQDANAINYLMNELRLIGYRSMLSLTLNRNFVFYANLRMKESIKQSDGTYREVYYFLGYNSFKEFSVGIDGDRAQQLSIIRSNLITIRNLIVDYDYYYYEGKPKNQLIIEFYDNASGSSSPHIVADIDKNSLKVRISGVLTEVGWE